MNISFIIVTNGQKPQELELQKKSILGQNIENYEIIIVGDWREEEGIKYIEAKDLTDKKLLGALRNKACAAAQYENLVISDDDMVFSPNWYEVLKKTPDFSILTGRVRLPDGGRFWDHACFKSPVKGHRILEGTDTDDHLYMSGGQSWVMKREVFSAVKWGEEFNMAGGDHGMSNIKDYLEGKQNEDTDFAERCRSLNFTITHNHNLVVWHNDNTYTTVGTYSRRRQNNRRSDWVLNLDSDFPPPILASMSTMFFSHGFQAEGFDLARHALSKNFKNPELENVVAQMEGINGGKLSDVDYDAHTCNDYQTLIKELNS